MAKIQITESDIKRMVSESVRKIFESTYGTKTGEGEWIPTEDETLYERGYDVLELAEQGVIDKRFLDSFDIEASKSCERVASTYDYQGYDDDGEVSFGGDYDEAVKLIEAMQDPKMKEDFKFALDAFCEGIECEDFEEYEPDWDCMPGGHDYYEEQRIIKEGEEEIAGIAGAAPGPEGKIFLPNIFGNFDTKIRIRPAGDKLVWEYAANEDGTVPNKGEIPWRDSEIETQIARHEERIWAELSK